MEHGHLAEETAELVRQQILQQTGIAVLAQANIRPQMALNLLEGG
jgi:flagellin